MQLTVPTAKKQKLPGKMLLCLAGLAFSTTCSYAQTWDASGVSSFTSGTAGVGLMPAFDARFKINNIFNNDDLDPLHKIPAFIIQRENQAGMNFSPWGNIMEIWSQIRSVTPPLPPGPNKLAFVIDAAGQVGINKQPGALLDVGGDANVDNNLSIGQDATVGNTLVVNNDAIVRDLLLVEGDAALHADLKVMGSTTLNADVFIPDMAGSADGLLLARNTGQLSKEAVPALSITGGNITLSNGGSIHSTISLPPAPAGDNLGDHKATINLNMNGKSITGANQVNATEVKANSLVSGMFTLNQGVTIYGKFTSVFGGAAINATRFDGNMCFNSAPGLSSYDISCNGKILALDFVSTSDKRFKKNIRPVQSIREQLFRLNAYSYNFNKQSSGNFTFDEQTNHYGFLAQEMKALFPDLAPDIDNEGHMGVNYVEVIPLLLQALKEEDEQLQAQQKELALLRDELTALKNRLPAPNLSVDAAAAALSGCSLKQNIPNPFGTDTRIGFVLNQAFDDAFIGIYTLNGEQIQQLPIDKNTQEVRFDGRQLPAGIYLYSLVVNNTLVDSKRMVITH